jgi:hypothetical protein
LKETISRIKRKPIGWVKFSSALQWKRDYYPSKKLAIQRTNNSINKWAKELDSFQKYK